MTSDPVEEVLAEQRAYYRARAPEYDDWWFRTGQHALTPRGNERWREDRAAVEQAVRALRLGGDVLELACGTGLWTRVLVEGADEVTAVDASPEVLALNRRRLPGAGVRYVEADLFAWDPPRRFDVVFFSFWLSHVPAGRFEAFWGLVERALAPGGRAVVVDSRFTEGRHETPLVEGELVERRLSDGSTWRIVKVFHRPDELADRLLGLGWAADVRAVGPFLLGVASRP